MIEGNRKIEYNLSLKSFLEGIWKVKESNKKLLKLHLICQPFSFYLSTTALSSRIQCNWWNVSANNAHSEYTATFPMIFRHEVLD